MKLNEHQGAPLEGAKQSVLHGKVKELERNLNDAKTAEIQAEEDRKMKVVGVKDHLNNLQNVRKPFVAHYLNFDTFYVCRLSSRKSFFRSS